MKHTATLLLLLLAACMPPPEPTCGTVLELDPGHNKVLIGEDRTSALKVCYCTTADHYNASKGEHHCFDDCKKFITRTTNGDLY